MAKQVDLSIIPKLQSDKILYDFQSLVEAIIYLFFWKTPVVSCLVMKDSDVAGAVGRGNLRAMHIRQDCKSVMNRTKKQKIEGYWFKFPCHLFSFSFTASTLSPPFSYLTWYFASFLHLLYIVCAKRLCKRGRPLLKISQVLLKLTYNEECSFFVSLAHSKWNNEAAVQSGL